MLCALRCRSGASVSARSGIRVTRPRLKFSACPVLLDEKSKEEMPPPTGALAVLKKLGMHPDDLVAPQDVGPNWRYRLLPAAIINNVALGSVYAWSIFNQPLTRLEGVLVPAVTDWTLGDVSLTFSLVMGGFVWGAVLGKYLEDWGPRATCTIGALSLGGGFGLGALAIHLHSLPLLWTGGAVWGLANGWAYVPPVATLLKWFPDRKGFAAGSAIVGYGGGAMIAAPIFTKLLSHFERAPEFVGSLDAVKLTQEGGHLFAEIGGHVQEVVVATAADVAQSSLSEGVYLVGSGSTGAAETFLILGAGYCAAMLASAMVYRTPPPGYAPPASKVAAPVSTAVTSHNVDVSVATYSPQFWLGWSAFLCSSASAFAILSCGKTLLSEAFGTARPDLVTAGFAATFVASISASNLGGRLMYSNASDLIARKIGGDPFYGRRATYSLMFASSLPAFGGVYWSVHQAAEMPDSYLPVGVFCVSIYSIVSAFGGTAATMPAMMGDLFGTKSVGIITARQLSSVLPAALLGPRLMTNFRQKASADACHDLSTFVPDATFVANFGASKEDLPMLIEKKTVTINRLLELAPPGTADPTPFLYDSALITMSGLPLAAFVCSRLMKPLDPSKHLKEAEDVVISDVTTKK